jgi:hypothetical protein
MSYVIVDLKESLKRRRACTFLERLLCVVVYVAYQGTLARADGLCVLFAYFYTYYSFAGRGKRGNSARFPHIIFICVRSNQQIATFYIFLIARASK